MKQITNKILLSFAALAVLLVIGCTEDFEEINKNPNQPTEANNAYLLTNAQMQLNDNYWDEWLNGRCGMLWSQYWSQNEYTEESRYRARPTTDNNYWLGFYRPLKDLQEIIETNAEKENPNVNSVQVARILQSYYFHVMTDVWGQIPYSEALQGTENLQPSFDSQSAIYEGILTTLKDAQSKLDPESIQPIKGDMIYHGDVNKWKKFANSLRLRVATRMKDANLDLAQKHYDEAKDAAFESNADNATFVWGDAVPNNNPLNENQKTRTDFSISTTFMGALKEHNDPRIPIYAEPISPGSSEYVGMPYGMDNSSASAIGNTEVSQPGWEVYKPAAPTILMTYDEVLFIKEEWNKFDGSYFKDAVRANMNFWGVDADAINDYLVTLPSDPEQEDVYMQKWFAYYMQGIQAWSHVRRTNVPDLDRPVGGIMQKYVDEMEGWDVPRRRPYPNNIYDLNKANLDKALASQGDDQIGVELWWNK